MCILPNLTRGLEAYVKQSMAKMLKNKNINDGVY